MSGGLCFLLRVGFLKLLCSTQKKPNKQNKTNKQTKHKKRELKIKTKQNKTKNRFQGIVEN